MRELAARVGAGVEAETGGGVGELGDALPAVAWGDRSAWGGGADTGRVDEVATGCATVCAAGGVTGGDVTGDVTGGDVTGGGVTGDATDGDVAGVATGAIAGAAPKDSAGR